MTHQLRIITPSDTIHHYTLHWNLGSYVITDDKNMQYKSIDLLIRNQYEEKDVCILVKQTTQPPHSWIPLTVAIQKWSTQWVQHILSNSARNTVSDPELLKIHGFRRVDASPCGFEFYCTFEHHVNLWVYHSYLVVNPTVCEQLTYDYGWDHKKMRTAYLDDLKLLPHPDDASMMHPFNISTNQHRSINHEGRALQKKRRRRGQLLINTFFANKSLWRIVNGSFLLLSLLLA